jgi:hypothetical protein
MNLSKYYLSLSTGGFAIIDCEDFYKVEGRCWFKRKTNNRSKTHYAMGQFWDKNTKISKLKYLHRVIMGAKSGEILDHINGNGLDCRKENLRFCSITQNNINSIKTKYKNKEKSSKYRGVCFNKVLNKWQSNICINKCQTHLGVFESEVAAAKAYDSAAKKYFGEFARLNFGDTL